MSWQADRKRTFPNKPTVVGSDARAGARQRVARRRRRRLCRHAASNVSDSADAAGKRRLVGAQVTRQRSMHLHEPRPSRTSIATITAARYTTAAVYAAAAHRPAPFSVAREAEHDLRILAQRL